MNSENPDTKLFVRGQVCYYALVSSTTFPKFFGLEYKNKKHLSFHRHSNPYRPHDGHRSHAVLQMLAPGALNYRPLFIQVEIDCPTHLNSIDSYRVSCNGQQFSVGSAFLFATQEEVVEFIKKCRDIHLNIFNNSVKNFVTLMEKYYANRRQ